MHHDTDPPSDIIRITGCMPSVDDLEAFVIFTCIIISETGTFRTSFMLNIVADQFLMLVIVALTFYRRWETSGYRFRTPWLSSKTPPGPRSGSSRSPIVRTMYRDGMSRRDKRRRKDQLLTECAGIHYYIFLLIVSVANLCVTTLESVSLLVFAPSRPTNKEFLQPAGRSILQMCVQSTSISTPVATLTSGTTRCRPVRAVHSALCTRVLLNLRVAAARSSELPTTTFARVTALAFEDPYSDSYTRREVALEMEMDNVDEDSRTYTRVQE